MKRWLVLGMILVGALGSLLLMGIRARNEEDAWTAFVSHWEKKGESFAVIASAPAPLADADEFISQPWISRLVAKDPDVLASLEAMNPNNVEGYEAWFSDTNDDGIPKPMPADLAQRVLDYGNRFKTELDAFSEATRRKGFFLGKFDAMNPSAQADWMPKLAPLANLLGAMASASAVKGDTADFTRSVETSLLAGNKFRASNEILAIVVGVVFETDTYQALRALQKPAEWPGSERSKWMAALDLRTRSLGDEGAAVLRRERGKWLAFLEATYGTPVKIRRLSDVPVFRRAYLASAKLGCCRLLQETVLAPGGEIATSVDEERIVRFENLVSVKGRGPVTAEAFGLLPYIPLKGIFSAISASEEDRTAARKFIGESR